MAVFLGLDTSIYPGDNLMKLARTQANISFAGFYLAPAPSHSGTSWMKKRSFLSGLGYGFAPTYLGQQQSGPGSHILSAKQGVIDGKNAAALAEQAGFPLSSVIYLDIESGPPLIPAQLDYYAAWVQSVTNSGFSPGVYCSHLVAAQCLAHAHAVPWVFQVSKKFYGQVLSPPLPAPDPSKSNFSGAKVLQFAQNCTLNMGSSRIIPIDFDTALMPDPSVSPDVPTPT